MFQLEDLAYVSLERNSWMCPKCLKDTLPLYAIESDNDVQNFLNGSECKDTDRLDELLFDPFEIGEEGGVFGEIDPDDNHLNVLASQTTYKCKYYLPNELSTEIGKHKQVELSVIHLNIRSTKKNFRDLQIMLQNINHSFSVVALTESWLKPHNVSLFDLEGYTHEYITREKKQGGGISMYIKDCLNYKIREDLGLISTSMEMMWIEIDFSHEKNKKNLIIGTIYRTPGSDIEMFNNKLSETLNTIIKESKDIL